MKCNSDYYLGVFNETHDANEKDQEKKIVIYFFIQGIVHIQNSPSNCSFIFFCLFYFGILCITLLAENPCDYLGN